jgi:hypothetical protein
MRPVPPGAFEGAPKYHAGGVVGHAPVAGLKAHEVPAILMGGPKGVREEVLHPSDPRHSDRITPAVMQIIRERVASEKHAGFSDGGYTGDKGVAEVAGVVHGREYVFSAPAVQTIGRDVLETLHASAAAGNKSAIGSVLNVNSERNISHSSTEKTDRASNVTQRSRLFSEDVRGYRAGGYVDEHARTENRSDVLNLSRIANTRLETAAAAQGRAVAGDAATHVTHAGGSHVLHRSDVLNLAPVANTNQFKSNLYAGTERMAAAEQLAGPVLVPSSRDTRAIEHSSLREMLLQGESVPVAGTREIGGPVSAASLYRVNERGPELLEVGGAQYLMTGSKGGEVMPVGSEVGRGVTHQAIHVHLPPQATVSRTTAMQAGAIAGQHAAVALRRQGKRA